MKESNVQPEKVEEPKPDSPDDGLSAKIRHMEKRLDNLKNFLEVMFRFDINGDGKIGE